ncbi:MAG: hypothetical protein RLZ63_679 [Pseudomonadota bacterium]|jgi:leucine efflux protein
MDLGIHNFWQFLLGTIVIVLLPGPNSLYVITASARHDRSKGWQAAFGIFTGDTLLILATASGAASLMHLFPTAFMLFKTAGAIYLGYIGFQLLRQARDRWLRKGQQDASPVQDQVVDKGGKPYWRALSLSLTNPKAILFFLAFFTQFVREDAPSPALAYLVLGIVVQICSLLYLWMLIVAGARLKSRFRAQHRMASASMGLIGVFFLGFAFRMIWS